MTVTLKNSIRDNEVLRVIGCNNPLSAKIGQESGFDGLWLSGFELSTAMCVPDASILSMSDNLYFLSAITRLTKVPIIADCDTGYGDLNNVIYMVKEYERIGVNAISIEDKLFPKLNSFCGNGQQLLNAKDFAAKIIAAKEARSNDNFLIFARTEAFISGASLSEVLDRAYCYEEAGADLLIVHSKKSDMSEIAEFCENFKGNIPLGLIPTTYYQYTAKELKSLSPNIKMIIYANYGIRAVIKALKYTYSQILSNDSAEPCEDSIASIKEAFNYQEMEAIQENYRKYNGLAQLLRENA